jgi:serine/threonine-protein kinase HipA
MIFNEYAKNFDDHTKNVAFLMNKKGVWSLAPAFDMTFSYKKDSIWVSEHQMLINGKSGSITNDDFLAVADNAGIKRSDAIQCEEQVREAVSNWSSFAEETDLSKGKIGRIQKELKR